MPITPNGAYMNEREIRNIVHALRVTYGPALKRNTLEMRQTNLSGMRGYYETLVQQAERELARADALERVLQ